MPIATIPEKKSWRSAVAPFERPSLPRSLAQLADTLIPYLLLLTAMIFSLSISYWLTLALAVPAAGFLVRAFIIFHDCGHGSFFRSRRANRIMEFWTGLLTFMPAQGWSRDHAKHHATAGDLDHRGTGDIWTLTLQEYRARSTWGRFKYRLFRHPLVLFVLGPLYIFLIEHRVWPAGADKRRRWNVIATNAALAAIVLAASLTIGFKAYLLIQLPILMFSGAAGVWLFYVQHQFEDTYWERHDGWDFARQALAGSSFYKLPRLLQWFSGNIGYHHIHHLSPRIPNYFLQRCHESNPMFSVVEPLTMRASLHALRLHLWDEEQRKLVGFEAV
jgi:omega-6 fatty acid desaturase (delta-12 desaturase)